MSVDSDDHSERIELNIKLGQLRRRVATLAQHLERARHRASMFPSDFMLADLRKLNVEHNHLIVRIELIEDELRALAPPDGPTL